MGCPTGRRQRAAGGAVRRQAAHRCGRERGVSPLVETGDIDICGAAIFGMLVLKLLKQNTQVGQIRMQDLLKLERKILKL